jgi:nicotinamidase-related amidase
MMNAQQTALLLIGFQNDYFAPAGVLNDFIEDPDRLTEVLRNTVQLIEHLEKSPVLMIIAPIFFTSTYEELVEPIGILKKIKEVGAFRANSSGSAIVEELTPFRDRIIEVPGRRGFNAFIETALDQICKERQIANIVLAGTIASVCIDSTGRHAQEQGYHVTILSDCISARTAFERQFYSEQIFPLYADVMNAHDFLKQLSL